MTWITWIALGVGVLLVAVSSVVVSGNARWASATKVQMALPDAMMVPTRGEAAWMRPEGRKPYFVGHLTSPH